MDSPVVAFENAFMCAAAQAGIPIATVGFVRSSRFVHILYLAKEPHQSLSAMRHSAHTKHLLRAQFLDRRRDIQTRRWGLEVRPTSAAEIIQVSTIGVLLRYYGTLLIQFR
jgi:hypothetical protein